MVKDSVPASEISCNEGNGKGKTLSWTDKLVEAFDASSGVNIYSEEQALWAVDCEIQFKMHALLIWFLKTGFALEFIRERVWFSLWSLADFAILFLHLKQLWAAHRATLQAVFLPRQSLIFAVVGENRKTNVIITPTFQI